MICYNSRISRKRAAKRSACYLRHSCRLVRPLSAYRGRSDRDGALGRRTVVRGRNCRVSSSKTCDVKGPLRLPYRNNNRTGHGCNCSIRRRKREQRIAGDAATLRGANSYTDNRFGQLSKMVDENRDEARAGTAAALAASQIPQVSQGRDFSLGAGVGTYRGENAIAVGVSARFNERTVTKFAVTADSQSGVGAGAGVSYEW